MYNRTFIKYFSFFNFHYIAFNPDAINVYCYPHTFLAPIYLNTITHN